jgi:hypothetical protein
MHDGYSFVYQTHQGSGFRLSPERRRNVIQRTSEHSFRKLLPNRPNPAALARDELAMGKTETINPRHGASLKEYDHAS